MGFSVLATTRNADAKPAGEEWCRLPTPEIVEDCALLILKKCSGANAPVPYAPSLTGELKQLHIVQAAKKSSDGCDFPASAVQDEALTMLSVVYLLPQVAKDCAFLPLALVIAGSTPPVVDDPLSSVTWWQLHHKLQKRAKMQRLKGREEKSLHAALDVSYDELAEEQQDIFVKLAVLGYDVTAPIEMLRHLWGKQVGIVLVEG